MFKRLFFYFAASLILVLVITSVNKAFRAKKDAVKQVVGNAPQLFSQMISQTEQSDASQAEALPALAVETPPQQEADPQFVLWFNQESQLVGSRQLDQKQKEAEISQKMKNIRAGEVHFLQSKSLDMSIAQNERLLSTYMLTMGGAAAKQALIDIASHPLQTPSPAPAHSLDELKLNSEKSHKIMSMDAIFEGSESAEQKIKDLETIKSKLSDASLIIYAQRKIDELKSQL